MTERRWRMRRVAAGDYLLPSDDLSRLYRIHQYEDGRILGLQVNYERRSFWRLAWCPYSPALFAASPDNLPDAWQVPWVEVDWYLPSRRACIELAR